MGNSSLNNWASADQTLEDYLEKNFHSDVDDFDTEFRSELTHEGMPHNVPFRAAFTHIEHESMGIVGDRMGDEEFILLCADCHGPCYCISHTGQQDDSLCQDVSSSFHEDQVSRCQCEHGFIGPLCQTRPVEGKLLLHMDQGVANDCSICGEHDEFITWELIGFNDQTCVAFPRKPLLFAGADDTVVSYQLGLNLNKTHFSLIVASNQTYLPKFVNDGPFDEICTVQEGSTEIYFIERKDTPQDQTHLGFAVLINASGNVLGKIVDPVEIDCFTTSNTECDGQISHLMRAWIQFDLKVTV